MSVEGSFKRYVCDRPPAAHSDGKERREYIKEGNVKENDYHKITHTDIHGASFEYLLCKVFFELCNVLITWSLKT